MHRHRFIVAFALTTLVSSMFSGCFPGDVGITLIPSPETLDFGASKTSMTLEVSRNVSTTSTNPLVVSASADWVIPGECLSSAAGCMLDSTVMPVRVPVTIRRELLTLGTNRAKLYLSAGPSSQVEVDVLADDRIQSDFTADARTVALGRPVVFRDLSVTTADNGPITSWLWDFGDGTTSTVQNPTHLYAAPGTYDVSLKVQAGDEQETLTRAGYVKVSSPDVAVDFAASETNVSLNTVVAFTDLSSSTATPITGWDWDFGDGIHSAERNPYHQYNTVGLYTVTLTVSTQFGQVAKTKPNYINVRQKIGPTANFAISDIHPFVHVPIRFTDTSDPGTSPITNWVWEFDDLVIVNDQNPVHAYDKVGTYNVKLTVFTAEGVSSKTMPVTVDYQPPSADFAASSRMPAVGDPVLFTDRSQPGSNTIVAWSWDFGDKGTSTEQNPTHTYAKAGSYTVSLTVRSQDPTNNEDTETKTGYITVVMPPVPDFVWTPRLALTGSDIDFDGTSTVAGTEPITSYTWDFDGDPETTADVKTGPAVVYKYSKPGVYNVILTVRTANRAVSVTKPVTVDRAPNPDFSATQTTGITSDDIVFTNVAQAGNARPITGYLWDFGDGSTSTQRRPTHRYTSQGTYKVRLTLSFRHSASLPTDPNLTVFLEKPGYITITAPTPPAAAFKSDTACPIADMPVTFTVTSYSSPTRPITEWKWDFGDGSAEVVQTAAEPDPVTHAYTAAGEFQPTLTVTAAALDPADGVRSFTLDTPLPVIVGTPLDEYVRADDGAYSYNLVNTFPVNYEGTPVKIADAYIIQLTSQVWHAADVYSPADAKWRHYLTLINPVERLTDTALLYVNGGSNPNFGSVPTSVDSAYAVMAAIAGSPIALLDTVPCEPMIFKDEVTQGSSNEEKLVLRQRSEDDIIAYSYNKYIEEYEAHAKDPVNNPPADTSWPLLFPMAKAVVKAMDTIQDLAANPDVGFNGTVKDFIVSGGSKRGWTTWMTGVTDCRLKGIAPIVIDVLNMDKQMAHHRASYGYWAPTVYPYAQERVFDRMLPEASQEDKDAATALLELVDPYRYISKGRLNLPKLVTTASRDEFFLPDGAQWYFHELPGENNLDTLPNRTHGIYRPGEEVDPTSSDDPAAKLMAWFMSVSQDKPRPQFSWNILADGSMRVTVDPNRKPKSVRMWSATVADKRDFRVPSGGSYDLYQPQTLLPETTGGNTYLAAVPAPPANSWTAYFVELTYANTAKLPGIITNNPSLGITVPDITMTTEVNVLPQVHNQDGTTTNVYPEFTGYLANAVRSDAVTFPESTAPVIVLYGKTQPKEYADTTTTDAYKIGYEYGTLMAQEIVDFVDGYVMLYTMAYGVSEATLMDAWNAQAGKVDQRIKDEMDGILQGVADAGFTPPTLARLQEAHMVAERDSDGLNGSTSTGKLTGTGAATAAWRSRTTDGSTLHAATVNGSLQLGWLDHSGATVHPQDFLCVVVYIPGNGVPHTLLTHAGLTVGRAGVNLGGITWSDQLFSITGVPPQVTPTNLNRLFLGRQVLYSSLSLDEAVSTVVANPVERSCWFTMTDGRNHQRGCLIQSGPNITPVPNYNRSGEFDKTSTSKVAGMVYSVSPSLNATGYFSAINTLFSGLNESNMRLLATDSSVTAPTNNLLDAVFNCSEAQLRINFSFASGTSMAYQRPFNVFDMQLLMP